MNNYEIAVRTARQQRHQCFCFPLPLATFNNTLDTAQADVKF